MNDPEKVYEEYIETKQAMKDALKPTEDQVKEATKLLRDLGYDVDDYDFEEMNKWEVEDLISGLQAELKNEIS